MSRASPNSTSLGTTRESLGIMADMTDAELSEWLRDADDDIQDVLNEVVDTEGDLLRLKQRVAQEDVP